MKKTIRLLALVLTVITLTITACKKDTGPAPEKPIPTLEQVEIGLNNNEIGIIGRDFHFNATVTAGERINLVQIKIQQRSDETYTKKWSHEITWEQYKGARNTTIHKHFDIPDTAVEGQYDFIIIVSDENGTLLEEKRTIRIYAPENLPVDPQLLEFSVSARTSAARVLYIYTRGGYRDPVTLQYGNYPVQIMQHETLSAAATIGNIKGDGKIYVLLINKKQQHRPESISAIDFSKVSVVDVFEHKEMEQTDRWGHVVFERAEFPEISRLLIGAVNDNNTPPAPINGQKSWETGNYYVGFIYHNTTYNMSLFHYIEVGVKMDE